MKYSLTMSRSWKPWLVCLMAFFAWATIGTINPEQAFADKPSAKFDKKSKSKSPHGNQGSHKGNKYKPSTRLNFGNSFPGGYSSNHRHSGNNHSNRGSGFGIQLNLSPYGLGLGNSYGYRGTSSYYRPTYGGYGSGYSTYGSGYGSYDGYPSYGSSSYYSGSPTYNNYSAPNYGGNSLYPTPLDYAPQYDIANPGISGNPTLTGSETAARADMFNGAATQPSMSSNPYYSRIATSASARSFQSRAEQAFKNADYNQAANLAEQALAQDPKNDKLRLFVSHADFAVGNFVKAVHHLDQATHSAPSENWSVVVRNFREFYGKNDYVSQTDRLNREIASRPTAGALSLRGFHYGSLGYAEAATVDFQQALAIDPSFTLARRLLPVLGIPPQPVAPEDIQAPVPAAVPQFPNGIVPLKQTSQSNGGTDGIIRLVPQFTDAELEAAVPVETGKSILLDGPSK